jgi:uncharacterized protein (DUF4415 family)
MSKPKSLASVDAATAQLMRDLEQGLQEAHEGVYARVSTPADIAKRAIGRPLQATHKQPVTLRMDPQALEGWRASGKGWQTRAAELLAKHAPG